MNNSKFDAIRFLQDYNIPFNESSGINTANFVAMDCPFCGGVNKLGFHKEKFYSTCWKCGHHSGYELLQSVTGQPYVRDIVNEYGSFISEHTFHRSSEVKRIIPSKVEMIGSGTLDIHSAAYRYIQEKRGFDPTYLFDKYNLTYTTYGYGEYNYRIIFPITFNGRLVSYQARDYTGDPDRIRFRALGKDKEIISHQDIFYNLDNCGLDSIIIVEGIFDALRVGANCACSFGIAFTVAQADYLREHYKRIFILYDEEERAQLQAEKLGYMVGVGKTEVELITLGRPGDDPDSIFQGKPDDVIYLKKELKVY